MPGSFLAFAIGAGIAVSGLCSLLYHSRSSINRFVPRPRSRLKKAMKQSKPEVDKIQLLLSLATGILFAGLAGNFRTGVIFFAAGLSIGLVFYRKFQDLVALRNRNQRLKDLAVLFEAVELYTRAGYTIPQALRAAKVLTPGLKTAIEKCLDYWPAGPRAALEQFRRLIQLPEGDIFVSLLTYMEATGVKDLEGVLGREADNIERLRRLRAEASIASRPVYLMVYRVLPLVATLGILVGPLLYRTYRVMKDAGISPI